MKYRMYIAAAAMVLAPVTLQAQSAQGQAQSTANANARAQARIQAAMEAGAKARIPAALLESKVREGRAKQVPQERIAAAVETRLQALINAQQAMNRAKIQFSSDSELAVASDALQAGVSEKALVNVYRDAPSERRVVAVAVLTDLVRLGTASETALARVSAAVRSNNGLANLHAEVASKMRRGGLGTTLEANGILRVK
jgi:hypothetical protein